MRRAFSLLELVVVLAISGFIAGYVLLVSDATSTGDQTQCAANTRQQLNDIRNAVDRFARSHDRLPMPAQRNLASDNSLFGREAVAANVTLTDGVYFGALPFQALGLAPAYAGDCWGNKYTYAVTAALTTNATSGGFLDSAVNGAIALKRGPAVTINSRTAYAVISHGPDEVGAVALNYAGATPGWCSGAGIEQVNCSAGAAAVVDAPPNDGADAGVNRFDDIVVAAGKPQMLLAGGGGGGGGGGGSCAGSTDMLLWDDPAYDSICGTSVLIGGTWQIVACPDVISTTPPSSGCQAGGYPALADGESVTVTNLTNDLGGSMKVTCNNGTVEFSEQSCTSSLETL